MSVPIAGVPGYPVISRTLLMVFVIAGLAGCASSGGYPDRVVSKKVALADLAQYFTRNVIADYNKKSGAEKRAFRDEVIWARMSAIDIHHTAFQKAFYRETAITRIGTDVAILALSAAGAVTGASSTKAILAAASGALAGTKISIDKNLYFQQTLPALFTQMKANRTSVRARIIAGMRLNIALYSLHQGLANLEEYYKAGTIPGAIVAITADAGEKSKKADAEIKKLTIERTSADAVELVKRSTKIALLISKIDNLSDFLALFFASHPPVTNDACIKTVLNARFRGTPKEWKTNPASAKAALKMRVTLMCNASVDLPRWEAALQ